jgi:predicted nucleic acid-binding protein
VILVDTSIWVDHFRRKEEELARLLNSGYVLLHPFVLGEIALGDLNPRGPILYDLARLPRAVAANDLEVLRFVESNKLFGRGIGYVDVHLLAAVRLTAGARLWTKDRRLHAVAAALDLAMAAA